ncbi:MAG: APC family permease [Gemmatimonadetes bacterium]|nr:APC family permease [Gemmatimonadota bacterium]
MTATPVAPPTTTAPAPARRLERSLGVGFGIAVGVGSMIGAGILRAPAEVARQLPMPSLFLGAWLLGAVYALLGANAIAELACLVPRSGGQYVFVRKALGGYPGFLVGWNDWLSTSGSVAAIAIVEAEAIGALLPPLASLTVAMAEIAVAITTIVLLRGLRASDRAQRTTSVLKALVLLALVAACIGWRVLGGKVAASPQAIPAPRGFSLLAALAIALQGVIFAYDGWTGVVYFSGEVRDPGREIPRALVGGLLSTMSLYVLLNLAFLVVLPLSALAAAPLAAASAASVVFGSKGGLLVQLLIALAMPSALVANALCASRVAYALGQDGLAPSRFGRMNASGTPSSALLGSALAAALLLLSGTFERIIAICAFLFVASYALSFLSVFVLRRREPDTPRPYRAWGHPWTTSVVLLASLAFLGATLAADPRGAAIVAALLVLSYPAYRIITRRAA